MTWKQSSSIACLTILILMAAASPAIPQVNAITKPMLENAAFTPTLAGAWYFTGKFSLPHSTALPSADCDAAGETGRVYQDTDAPTGQQFYLCESVGWVLQGGGGGGGPSDRLTSVTASAGDTMILTTDAATPTKDILTFSRTPLRLVGTAPFTAEIFDDASDLATHWQSNRGIFMSKGKTGGFLGAVGGIGAIDEGEGSEIYFTSNGGMVITRPDTSAFNWTHSGHLSWNMTSGSGGTLGAGLQLNQLVGSAPILDLEEAGALRLRFDEHGVISLLNSFLYPHIASNATISNPGFVYSDRVPFRSNDLMQFQVESAAIHKEFFGFNNNSTMYIGQAGIDTGAFFTTAAIGLNSGAKGTGSPRLYITTFADPATFDTTAYGWGMQFKIGQGKSFLVDLDQAIGANDSYFHVRKNDADSTTANDLFQIEHVNATIGGTRNLLSIKVGATKGFFVDKTFGVFSAGGLTLDNQKGVRLREADANGDEYEELKAPASLTANRTHVLDLVDATCTGDANAGCLTVDGSGNIICSADDGGAGSGDNLRVEDGDNGATFTAATDADFEDSGDINFMLDTATTPDQISATIRADAVALTTDTAGNYVQSVATTAPLSGGAGGSEGAALTLTTSMTTARLIGRTTAATGVMEEITVASPLTLSALTLDVTAIADADLASSYSGVGDCGAGNFARTLNDNAAPTCSADDDVPEAGDFGALALTGDVTSAGLATTIEANSVALITDTTGNFVGSITGSAGIVASAAGEGTAVTIDTASGETNFLASGALTCGASTQGRMQVHTTPLQYCDNAGTPALQYAAYGNSSGESTAAAADSVALTTDTTGNYAAGDGEAGAALTGDTATAFFSAGQLEAARGGTADDTSATTGVPRIASGNWTYDAGVSHLAASTSADLRGVLSDDTGTGVAIFSSPTALTLDVEAGSNSVTTVSKIWLLAATCQNATAFANFDTPTTNAAAATCVSGTNTQKAYLDFDQTTDESVEGSLMLPADWTGAIDVAYKWLTTATTGSATWCTQVICVADAETGDPAYPAQAAGLCVTDAAKGTTNQYNDATDTGITAAGCAAGELMYYRISRDPNETATLLDNLAADARLVGVELTLRRAQ